MRKKIVYVEHRIAGLFADLDGDFAAVFQHDNAVECKRNSRPLVLLDTAVIVRFKQAETAVLVHGVLFKVDSRRVDVRCDDANAVGVERVFADLEYGNALVVVVVVILASDYELVAEVIRLVTFLLGCGDSVSGCLPLGLCLVEEVFVTIAVLVHFVDFFLGRNLEEIAFLVGQFFQKFLPFTLLFGHSSLLSACSESAAQPQNYFTILVYYLSKN